MRYKDIVTPSSRGVVREAAGDEENETFDRGYHDYKKGIDIDWGWIVGLRRVLQDAYLRGRKHAEMDTKGQMVVPLKKRLKIPTPFRKYLNAAIFPAVVNEVRSGSNLVDAPKWQSITPEDVENAMIDLASDVDGNGFHVYRTMDVPKKWVEGLATNPRALGRYWSVEEDYTMGHHGLERFQVKLRAYVPMASVDWAGTLATRLNNVESEIRIESNAPVMLLQAWIGNDGEWQEVFSGKSDHFG